MNCGQRGSGVNALINGLPTKDRQRLLARFEAVELRCAEIVSSPGERVAHVYFPTESFVSLIGSNDARSRLEVGLAGNEGMIGMSVLLGVADAPFLGIVRRAGSALRMGALPFCRELEKSTALRHTLNRYVFVMMTQFAQAAACNRYHMVEARLARWFLMSRDRSFGDDVRITHECLAMLLGVRRVGITRAATALQNRELIRYHRGAVTILDPLGMEAASCSCYRTDRETYARVMNPSMVPRAMDVREHVD